jgi:hypothetical protein
MIEVGLPNAADVIVGLFGPEWPEGRSDDDEISAIYGVRVVTQRAAFMVNASTFGRALSIYCRYFRCKLTPFSGELPEAWGGCGDQASYFEYTPEHGEERILDIHIQRGDEIVCPKQNLDFPLDDGDLITIGVIYVC